MYVPIKTLCQPGIEPGAQRWRRWILPLNHWHMLFIVPCCVVLFYTHTQLITLTNKYAHLPICPHTFIIPPYTSINTLHTHHATNITTHPHITPHTHTIQKYIYTTPHISTHTYPYTYTSINPYTNYIHTLSSPYSSTVVPYSIYY